MNDNCNIIKPGKFSIHVAADAKRTEFDYKNESVIYSQLPVDFVFLGDSIIERWELYAYFNKYNKVLINRGIGSDITFYMLKRFEADVIQLKPKCVVILGGVNNTVNLNSGQDANSILCETISDISKMIEMCSLHDIKLALCSILPTKKENTEMNKLIKRINESYRELAKSKQQIYVDFYTEFTDSDGISLKNNIAEDGIHPGAFGYSIMKKVLKETLSGYDIII